MPDSAPPSLEEYARQLRSLIEAPSSGMLLDANALWNQQSDNGHSGQAAFELTSGRFQKEFVTLWELFDQRQDFNTFIQMFAAKAREIRRKTPFSALVTSTATSKHIVEHVHASIEDDRDKVSIHYLGHYPFLNVENRGLLDFKGEDVLIVTDVVATGTLIRKMADIVKEVGGNPVGALCVALTGEELIANPRLRFNEDRPPILIHAMTTRPIALLKPGEFEPGKTFKIDPVTVLPEDKLVLPNGFRPRFSEAETFAHLESAQAIDFNFYQMDSRRITTAIRADCLLREHGDTIWAAIERTISQGTALVTTFNREDVRFKEFIEDRLAEPKPFVFVSKRDSLETPSSYFLLPPSIQKIQDGHVVLLFFSVHTSEKLRNIVSLLASHSVGRITALCLLNRMGLHTSNFLARIKSLLRGVGNGAATGGAGFEFISLYSLPDINSEDITRMQQTAGALFQHYAAETRVPSFRRWMSQDHKYFRSHSLTSRDFEHPFSHALRLPYTLPVGGVSITVHTEEGKLALLCRHVVATRDYGPLIQEISSLSDKETLYKLFGILLSDLSYLKMTGRFRDLRGTLIERIRHLRQERLALEGACQLGEIENTIEVETHLLFGLSLFSFLDHEFDYDDFLFEALTCGLDTESLLFHPDNLSLYFGNERIAWNLSTLMHFSHHKFRQPDVAPKLKGLMREAINRLIKEFEQGIPRGDDEDSRNRRNKVKANLNLLLTDLGVHELKAKHQVIRYLHSKVTTPRRGHNPIYSSVDLALQELERIVDQSSGAHASRRIRISGSKTKKVLEDAFYTAGILEEIADAVRQLLFFAQTSREEAQRFANEPELPGFSADIVQLGNIFQNIRMQNLVAQSDIIAITELRSAIFYDLWDSGSYLRNLLQRYIVPLRESIVAAMETASLALAAIGYPGVWVLQMEELRSEKPEALVLIDPHSLREILRNLFTNVRHSFDGYALQEGESWASLVSADIRKIQAPAPAPDSDNRDYFRLEVVSRRGKFRGLSEEATFAQHQSEVLGFAGTLGIKPLEGGDGTLVILTLLARKPARD